MALQLQRSAVVGEPKHTSKIAEYDLHFRRGMPTEIPECTKKDHTAITHQKRQLEHQTVTNGKRE